jgi:hypothetical protein
MTTIMQSFICPITQSIMDDPVIDYEGNTYDRKAITEWLLTHDTSPITRNKLYINQLNPNRALKETIELFKNNNLSLTIQSSITTELKNNNDELKPSLEINAYNFSSTNELYVDICIKTPEGNDIIPKDIVIVIDVSGSMGSEAVIEHQGEKQNVGFTILDITKHAINTIIESMNNNDRLSLISYSSYATILSDMIYMTDSNKSLLKRKISNLNADGYTNIWDGLNEGLTQINKLENRYNSNSSVSLILMTDGIPSENLLPYKGIRECLKRNLDKMLIKPTIYTFGFGYELDTLLLVDIAKIGNGYFSFIPDSGFVGTVLVNSISNINTTIARNALLKLNITNEAIVKKIIGYDNNEVISLDTLHYGQNKNIIVVLSVPDISKSLNEYLKFEFKYTPCDSKNIELNMLSDDFMKDIKINNVNIGNMIPENNNIKDNIMRLEFVEILANILYNNETNLEKSKDLFTIFNYKYKSYNKPICTDLNGQVNIAISNIEYFKKWGKNYIQSLMIAHKQQRCNNFKDVSVNEYGGKLFKEQRDKIDEIFSNMPAPKPSSINTYNRYSTSNYNTPLISMSMFNDRSNGCFHENSLVHMGDGTLKKIKYLVKGDEVLTENLFHSTAIVKCVIKTNCKNNIFKMSCLESGLIITPYHPIYNIDSFKWEHPETIEKSEYVECRAIYNLVLDSAHTIVLNNTMCITLGHNYAHDVLYHEFYGTDKVISNLSSHYCFEKGLIHFMHDNIIINDGKVIGYDFDRVIYDEIEV